MMKNVIILETFLVCKCLALSWRLAQNWEPMTLTHRERRTALRLVQSTRVLVVSNTPSPHRGAGGLKTLRDTAAPLGF